MASEASSHIVHVHSGDDLYEVSLQGFIIARITCWIGGTHRHDMQYDDLPESVKVLVLNKVKQVLSL
jgi:hypothetical protein